MGNNGQVHAIGVCLLSAILWSSSVNLSCFTGKQRERVTHVLMMFVSYNTLKDRGSFHWHFPGDPQKMSIVNCVATFVIIGIGLGLRSILSLQKSHSSKPSWHMEQPCSLQVQTWSLSSQMPGDNLAGSYLTPIRRRYTRFGSMFFCAAFSVGFMDTTDTTWTTTCKSFASSPEQWEVIPTVWYHCLAYMHNNRWKSGRKKESCLSLPGWRGWRRTGPVRAGHACSWQAWQKKGKQPTCRFVSPNFSTKQES